MSQFLNKVKLFSPPSMKICFPKPYPLCIVSFYISIFQKESIKLLKINSAAA